MSRGRAPNTGPYVVKYGTPGMMSTQECHTWAEACRLMRALLQAGYENISVRFV